MCSYNLLKADSESEVGSPDSDSSDFFQVVSKNVLQSIASWDRLATHLSHGAKQEKKKQPEQNH